ncbi:uncharacterized protein BXZ73DRAFT_107899 [Epithele typhae]|uniref:uncharacterized protein n=1 Tax=Epithele typhae TaxID=378194 RepID=UPI002008A069|nr:uncharacterized protein BXZ73DRAFT_107899 [Epithele typhae]KAH9911628.1 hypothetical protein BXZ73DRAFT_107899 [Epithele typhae]
MAALIIDRLNDDILLLILSYLEKRDLCALSLTCKHCHMISSPRLWAVLSIDRAFFVSWWHENLVTNAHYVREMAICVDLDSAPTLPDVLFATKNIVSLELFRSALLHDNPRLSMALAGLRELRKLSCDSVEDNMLPTIQNIPSPNLTSLCLGYKGRTHACDDLPSLISVIRSFPRLYALILERFNPATIDIANYPLFTSIQDLTFNVTGLAATDLIYLCPNVTSLRLSLYHPHKTGALESRPRWRGPSPIPRLTLTILHMHARNLIVSLLEQQALRATHVRFPMVWNFTQDGISTTHSRFTRIFDVLKPYSLYLEISATWHGKLFDHTGTLWQEVAAAAPHLRALLWAPPDALVAELAQLPLVCVHLKADPELLERKGDADLLRLRALAAFPRELAEAVPTLRVVGVSDGWGRLEGVRSTRWWRIERGEGDGAARSLVELWREDGERALRLVQNEAFCASDLDGIYSEKCRYVGE